MKKKKYDLTLRPHHVAGFIGHEKGPGFYDLPDEKYIDEFRKFKQDFHSDEIIIHWRDTIKRLHENLDLRFKYVQGSDSICGKCEHDKECSDKMHENYKLAKYADDQAIESLPELKIGEVYSGRDIIELMKKKSELKKEI